MNVTRPKKKLVVLASEDKTVLPEVLPDPTAARRTTGGPRQRTLAHMQRLLAGAAAMGATISCGKEPSRVTAPVVPDEGGATSGADAGSVEPKPTATATASVSAQPRPPEIPTGYAVVDPMPPPAHCPGIAQLVQPTVQFAPKGGGLSAVVHFPMPQGRADYKYMKGTKAVVYGGSEIKTEVKADGVTVTVMVAEQNGSMSVAVKGTCNQGPGTLTAHLSWQGKATAATKATVTMSEY